MRLLPFLVLCLCGASSFSAWGVNLQYAARCAARTQVAAKAAARDAKVAARLVRQGKAKGADAQNFAEGIASKSREATEANQKAQQAYADARLQSETEQAAAPKPAYDPKTYELGRQVVIAEHAAQHARRFTNILEGADTRKRRAKEAKFQSRRGRGTSPDLRSTFLDSERE
ncbi:MAG: hypothetical protein KA436_10965 [Oligoflexales bacterium]|nr:hypothetical protein [Oligoflexales bacterium]